MSKQGTTGPRPRRPTGAATRRQEEAMRRAAARGRWTMPVLIVSVLMLVAAVGIVARNLLQTNTASAPAATSGQAFVGPLHPNLVAGSPIDNISCGPSEGQVQHIHQHFEVFVDGKVQLAPANVGIIIPKKCLYWVHVHSGSPGVIHVEAPVKDHLKLGAFLDIWSASPVDQTLLQQIKSHPLSAVLLNGKSYVGDIRNIPLEKHNLITLEIGTPTVAQQSFDFSSVD